MSTGLMSCVRENSPPLEMSGSESGALSLPSSGAEPQQKRRRFHPLRNLRRIFRRRTMTSVDSPAISPVSSPSSPSSSQLSSTPTVIASVPAHSLSTYCKSSTSGDVTMSSTAYPPHLIGLSGGRGGGIGVGGGGNCAGVAIVSPFSSSASASSGFYIKDIREHSDNVFKLKESSANDLDDNREMTDCQRSFSEGRLVDSDFSRDGLSQSHDSVFSESATASSLSILKAELFDVLRKRRNRPDASDEDLGLPRSPTTPQRKDQTIKSNQSEVSSLSLLSMASSDLDDDYGLGERTTSSVSSKISPDTSRNSDEIDFVISIGSRLSHSAARHKMAVRPKKKGPTRHRRPIESTILPSTPEVNEEILKVTLDVKDITEKGKSHSLPPGVNAKILEQHSHDSNITKEATNSHIKRSKTEKVTSPTGAYSVRNISASSSTATTTTAASTSTIEAELHSSSSINSMFDRKEDEGGFFRRLLLRNSKKNKKNTDESDTIKSDDSQATSTTTISGIESSSSYRTYEKTEAEFIHSSSRVEETRKEIRKEILSEAKSSLSAMLNTFILSPDHETEPEPQPPPVLVHQQQQNIPKVHKPKSGPAARQRFIPKDLTNSPLPDIKIADMSTTTTTASTASSQFIAEEKDSNNKTSVILQYPPIKAKPEGIEVPKIMSFKSDVVSGPQGDNQNVVNKLDKSENTADALMTGSRMAKSLTEDSFRSSTSSVKETLTTTTSATVEHYEKRERIQPKIVGLSPFMQKMTRSEPFTLDSTHPVPKQRKSVEKSKSFRYYSENTSKDDIENGLKKHENMPSLPDLSYPRKISSEIAGCNKQQQQYQQLTQQQKQLPLAFEINDNNLIKLHRDEEPLPLSQGIYTKNIILTTTQKPLAPLFTSSSSSTAINVPKPLASPTCNQNITEIEENIDKLLIKSPFLTVLKKSSLLDENNCENNTKISNSSNNSSSFSSSNIINSTSNMTNKNATKISVTSIRRIDDFDNNNKIVEQFQATSTTIAAAAGGGNTKLIEKDVESKITPISSTVEKLVVNDEKQSSKLFGLEKSTSLEMLISDEKSSSAKLIIGGGGNTNEKKQSTTTTTEQKVLNEISSSTIDNAINKVELRKDSCNKSVSTTNKARRNSSVLEKFDNSSSNHVPEFMKIQLNRVESTRPKSNIVLSKNAKDSDDSSKIESTRRYSNESVELTDTKPPIPPAVAELVPLSNKRSSGTPAGTELPVSSKRISATTTSTPTTISSTAITSTTISSSQSKSLSDDELKSPKAVKKVDDDNTILRNTENTLQQQHQQTIQTIVFERRKSVTEEKLKYEKKVEELKLLEKKKPTVVLPSPTPPPPPAVAPPSSDDNNTRLIDSRKMSIDDETGVVLRKKSFALINQSINNNNNKDDSTPELMKVFARRSLKIKDEDIPNIEDLDKTTTTTTSTLKKFTNLDSDKENQSSSEEKLDKLPKVEITIQTANKQSKSDDIKTRNSLAEFRKPNITTTTQIQSTTGTPTKSFIQPMRYSSNIVGYRSVSTVFNNKTSSTTTTTQQSTALTPATTNQEQSSTTGTTTTVIQQQSNNNNTEQINNNNNNNNSNNNNNNNHYTSSTNSNVNNKKLVGIRHTIGPSTPTTNNSTTTPTTGIIDSKREDSSEFKGILQRRAEWEKRAKEALK